MTNIKLTLPENEGCDFDTTVYEIGFDPVTMRIACAANPDSCSINKCTCDEQLAHTLNGLIMTNQVLNQKWKSENFDFESECAIKSGSGNSSSNNSGTSNNQNGNTGLVQCCGEYPNKSDSLINLG